MPGPVSIGLGMVMVADAGTLAFLGWRCLTGRRVIDAVAVIVAVGNIVVTFTDQVGTLDLVYLSFAVTLLGTLVSSLVVRRKLEPGQ